MDSHIEELLPFYTLDALTNEERELVEGYLAEHPEARARVQELQSGASALPYTVSAVEPPGQVKEALMRRVTADVQARQRTDAGVPAEPSRGGLRFEDLFRVLSLGAATVAILWAFALNGQIARLQDQVASLNDQVTAQSQSLDELIRNLPQTGESDIISVSLKSTETQPRALGQLIADPNDQSAMLVISGLPPLEPGQTYQVWLIGNAPVSAGLLTVDENGQSVLIITSEEAIGSFNSVGISIEPEGGSVEPTGEIVVLSEL
ncbi:MAG TPA: anti-sigma factor [Anaerolineales bacterium]|nr:anti-sigma factor [Anaerolineales bacterium]